MEMDRISAFPANYTFLEEDVEGLPRLTPLSADGLSFGLGALGREFALVLPTGEGEYGTGAFLATTPDPDALLVGALGKAYLVDLTDPIQVTDLNCYAASACAAFPNAGALIVVDLTRLICLDAHGVAWTSSELSDDAIRFVGQDGDHILLETFSAPTGRWTKNRILVTPALPL